MKTSQASVLTCPIVLSVFFCASYNVSLLWLAVIAFLLIWFSVLRSKIISTDHCTIFRLFQSKMIIRCETLHYTKKVPIRCVSCFSQKWIIKKEREKKKVSFDSAFYFRQQDQNPRGETKTSDFNVRCRCFVHFWKLMLRLLLKCHKFDKQLLSNCVAYLIRSSPSPLQTAVFGFSLQSSSLPSLLPFSIDENSRYVLEWLDYSDMLCRAKLCLRNTCCHNGCDQNLWKPLS